MCICEGVCMCAYGYICKGVCVWLEDDIGHCSVLSENGPYWLTYLKVWCEGLNRSRGFIFLSAWPRGGGTIRSCGLVGVGALKEMCYYVDRF